MEQDILGFSKTMLFNNLTYLLDILFKNSVSILIRCYYTIMIFLYYILLFDWCEYILKSRNNYRAWTNKGNSLLNIRIEEKKSFFLN